MRFIPEIEAGALRAHLDKELEGPVTLDLFIEPKSAIVVPRQPECELCEETRALLEGVASLSDQITRVDGFAPHEPVHHIHYQRAGYCVDRRGRTGGEPAQCQHYVNAPLSLASERRSR